MKVIREKPSQRRHHRLTAPLYVKLLGYERILADNWSLGGLGLSFTDRKLPDLGDEITISITLPFQGYEMTFEAEVSVVRIDFEKSIAGMQFVNLSERSSDLLSYFIEDLVRGQMGTVEDSICRIDVPVTPISTEPSKNHVSETPVRRIPVKTIVMSTFYVFLGLAVFSYLGILLYSNFMRLEIPSSVVSTELQTLRMPVDGIIRKINYKTGHDVRAGDELLTIVDLKLERRIEDARLKVEAASKSLWQAKQKQRIETERMKLYQIVNRTDMVISKARLSSLRERLKSADSRFVRMSKLKQKGVATDVQLETAKEDQIIAEAAVKEAELLLEKHTAMDAVSKRRHYNHKEFVADLDMLAVDLEMAYSSLEMETEKLNLLEQAKGKLVMRAPFDGRVVSLFKSSNTNVLRNEPVVVLERADEISVTAYMNQDEILQIGLYDEASVYIPAMNKNFPAIVSKIDRSSLLLNKGATQYTWQDEKDKTAAVTLKLNLDPLFAAHVRAGLPVVVIFDRKETNDIWAKIKGVINLAPREKQANGKYQQI